MSAIEDYARGLDGRALVLGGCWLARAWAEGGVVKMAFSSSTETALFGLAFRKLLEETGSLDRALIAADCYANRTIQETGALERAILSEGMAKGVLCDAFQHRVITTPYDLGASLLQLRLAARLAAALEAGSASSFNTPSTVVLG